MLASVKGRRWRIREQAAGGQDVAAWLGPAYPPLIGRLLALRGVTDARGADAFFRGAPPAAAPMELPGIPALVERVLAAVRRGECIAVYGDYDVDGVTATAILTEGIAGLGGDAIAHIPNRFADGYGLTRAGLRAVRDRGARLVVTVDCGINGNAEVEYAAELGLEVLILDHHEPPAVLPDATVIVDPKLGGGPPEFDGLASCGLAFTTLRALYEAAGRSLDAGRYLELAALGTVADMVPLVGENRRIVREGLAALHATRRPGVRALIESARNGSGALTAETIAFRLAPRLNAAGRLAHAELALHLLTCEDERKAAELAALLAELNARRQRMLETALTLARDLAAEDEVDAPLVMVGHEQIAQGIVGLVAGKLVEERYRPSIVYERREDVCVGSVRGIPEFDVVRCLGRGAALMARWGGHSQAGGFTAPTATIHELKRVLAEEARAQLDGFDLQPSFDADVDVPLREIRGPEITWLRCFEPCGQENPTPVFVSRGLTVTESRTIGADGSHLRLKLRDGPASWGAVAFSMGKDAPRPGDRIDALYTVAPDRRGTMELQIKDFARGQ